jgi:acyl carrier protein
VPDSVDYSKSTGSIFAAAAARGRSTLPPNRSRRPVSRREVHPMAEDEIRKFVLESLSAMNYDTTGIDDDTLLGPAGADLESLALAELGVRAESRFGVLFDDDEAEQLGTMTVGEFCAAVAARIQPAPAPGR